MPIYSYLCDECHKLTEVFVFKYTDKPLSTTCEHCFATAFATATVAHVTGRHTNKDSVKVPGKNLSMTVDGFKVVSSPPSQRKMFRKNGRRLPIHKVPIKRHEKT